jgi:hypothetical protein
MQPSITEEHLSEQRMVVFRNTLNGKSVTMLYDYRQARRLDSKIVNFTQYHVVLSTGTETFLSESNAMKAIEGGLQ